MKNTLITLALLSLAPSLWALSYDANVGEPTPGTFFGSGNANGGWTVDTASGIELGLRTHQRYPSANVFNSSGNDVYSWVDTTGYGPDNRSSWNYDFSLNAAGTASQLLSDYVFKLWIDSDAGAGQSWRSLDPILFDNNLRNASGGIPTSSSDATYAQNSENARFAEGILGYDNTIAGSYDFVLQAFDKSNNLLASTYMRVNVNGGTTDGVAFDGSVPEGGSTVILLGSALAALGMLRRKLVK